MTAQLVAFAGAFGDGAACAGLIAALLWAALRGTPKTPAVGRPVTPGTGGGPHDTGIGVEGEAHADPGSAPNDRTVVLPRLAPVHDLRRPPTTTWESYL